MRYDLVDVAIDQRADITIYASCQEEAEAIAREHGWRIPDEAYVFPVEPTYGWAECRTVWRADVESEV